MADIRIPLQPIDDEPVGAIRADVGELRATMLAALYMALDGLELGSYDRTIVEWAAGAWDQPTMAVVCSWLLRTRDLAEDVIVLDRPAELGMTWHDGDDLLALTSDTILLFPGGADETELTADQAREMAAQLAAMAETLPARRPSVGGGPELDEATEAEYRDSQADDDGEGA